MDAAKKITALAHYQTLERQARSSYTSLPEPTVDLPFDAECVIQAWGAPWTAVIRFSATSMDGVWELGDIDVKIEPADVAYQGDRGPYRVDFTEMPRDTQELISEACMRAFEVELERD